MNDRIKIHLRKNSQTPVHRKNIMTSNAKQKKNAEINLSSNKHLYPPHHTAAKRCKYRLSTSKNGWNTEH